MSKKNLLIVAALLIAVAVFIQLYSKKDKRQGDTPVGKPLASVNIVEAIDEIFIEKDEKAIHLQKSADRWIIVEKNGFPADTQKLIKLFDNITTYRIAALITRDESRLADFQLLDKSDPKKSESAKGTLLQLKNGDKIEFKMVTGKSRNSVSTNPNRPSRPDGTYIRVGETPAVYLIKENFSLNSDTDDWINKTLITISKDNVKSVQFESPVSRFIFKRENGKSDLILAGLADTENMDKQALTELLEELNEFKINTALPLNSKLENSLRLKSEIAVSLFDQSTFNFQILLKTVKNPLAKKEEDKEEVTHYIKIAGVHPSGDNLDWQQLKELGKTWLFELDSWQAKTWLKSRKDFIKSKDK